MDNYGLDDNRRDYNKGLRIASGEVYFGFLYGIITGSDVYRPAVYTVLVDKPPVVRWLGCRIIIYRKGR